MRMFNVNDFGIMHNIKSTKGALYMKLRKATTMKLHKTSVFRGAFMRNALPALAAAIAASTTLPLAATAAETTVHNVAELTNAVTRANAGEFDKIILAKDGSPYNFTDEWMNIDGTATNFLRVGNVALTIEGEESSSRKGWTEGSEPVILNANGKGRLFFFENYTKVKTIRNICLTGGHCSASGSGGAVRNSTSKSAYVVFTNCVFRGNCHTRTDYTGCGAAAAYVTLRDCLVKDSYGSSALRGDGTANLAGHELLYGCDFVGNSGGVSLFAIKAWDCTFEANTNTSAAAVCSTMVATNCTFRSNYGQYVAKGSIFYNCTFTNNTTTGVVGSSPNYNGTTSVLYNPERVVKCRFYDNVNLQGPGAIYCRVGASESINMRVEDSTFLRNFSVGGAYGYAAGGAIRMYSMSENCTMFITNCTFEGNFAPSNNAVAGAIYNTTHADVTSCKAWDLATVVDCRFVTNTARSVSGVVGVHAINCTFDGNRRADNTQAICDAARDSLFEGCDFNTANFEACSFNRCRIHDATNNAIALFRGYTRVTNSIIENCKLFNDASMYRYSENRKDLDAEFVNCTIVSNMMRTYAPSASYTPLVGIAFKNCLLYGNYTGYNWHDISASEQSDQHSYLTFENTYAEIVSNQWGAAYNMTAADITRFTTAPNSLRECRDPKFAGQAPDAASRYPGEPFWELSPKSPLLGQGDPLDFTDADLDLAGRSRIREGKVDPGCYQCWLNPPGLMMIVR